MVKVYGYMKDLRLLARVWNFAVEILVLGSIFTPKLDRSLSGPAQLPYKVKPRALFGEGCIFTYSDSTRLSSF